ncbi:hypothetical protein, partial [Polyangium sp. y55x31]|uniref:hypothetical protein n=1 Tax=Polyangium sp. y55x31 TaxID=3042688 RepID=UPI0024821A02
MARLPRSFRVQKGPSLLLLWLLVGSSACSGASVRDTHPPSGGGQTGERREPLAGRPSAAVGAQVTRLPLGATEEIGLPMSVEPVFGEAAALLVSQAAGEPEGYVRWVEESGRMGPIVRLVDENVVLGFTRSDGKRALLTSMGGDRLCLSVFDRASEVAETRGCEQVGDVKAVAVSGERVALISVATVASGSGDRRGGVSFLGAGA